MKADKYLSTLIQEQLRSEGYMNGWFSEQVPQKCWGCKFLYERHFGLYVCRASKCRKMKEE
jgi:DUF1680 family protein